MLIDAHCHLANLSAVMDLAPLLDEAQSMGIELYLSSALTRQEVKIYQKMNDKRVLFSAGIHPNYAECDLELEDIRQMCATRQIWALGEIGLDRNGAPIHEQLKVFEAQLELAAEHDLPAVLHIVGHQQPAWEVMRKYPLKYLVHGYAGSVEGYRLLARENSWFTISERILRQDKAKLLAEMLEGGRYLFETDITCHYVIKGEKNPLLRLIRLLDELGQKSGLSSSELIRNQYQNYLELRG